VLVAPIKNRVLGGKWIWVEPNLFNKFAFLIELSLNLVPAGLRLGLKNRQVGEKWVSDDYSYLVNP
jgi:hypothetical protein